MFPRIDPSDFNVPPPASDAGRHTLPVLGAPIDVLDVGRAIQRISTWVRRRESRVVCICNAHSVVTGTQDPEFSSVLKHADMATADGAPVAWMLKRQGADGQPRVSGPDLMLSYCEHAAQTGEAIYLYGSTDITLRQLSANLKAQWPALKIAGMHAPPFRQLTADEDQADIDRINASGAGTLWISLGCPKQERWMANHRGRVHAVMLGVGAAFDFHAGTVTRAPEWMRAHGLEWLHRLLSEPRRLWKRYLVTNTLFIVLAARQLLLHR